MQEIWRKEKVRKTFLTGDKSEWSHPPLTSFPHIFFFLLYFTWKWKGKSSLLFLLKTILPLKMSSPSFHFSPNSILVQYLASRRKEMEISWRILEKQWGSGWTMNSSGQEATPARLCPSDCACDSVFRSSLFTSIKWWNEYSPSESGKSPLSNLFCRPCLQWWTQMHL